MVTEPSRTMNPRWHLFIMFLVLALIFASGMVALSHASSPHQSRMWIVVTPTVPHRYVGPFSSRSSALEYALNEGPVSFPTPGRVVRLVHP